MTNIANVFDEAIKALEEAIEYEKGNQKKGRSVIRELKTTTPEKVILTEKDNDSLQKTEIIIR